MRNILEVKNLVRSYNTATFRDSKNNVNVLKEISFQVAEGEFVGIMGKSGCGKTTLLKTLGMIDKPTDGTIKFMGEDTSELYGDKLLQMKINSLEAQYKEMLKSRKVVHDMKNHLLALKKYSQEQDWIGLNDYLNELSEDILDYNYQIWTGNRMLDMILNEKLKEAKDKKIDMQISTEVFTTLPFTDREIISLFGNLLDNAIEACERITDKNTWIHIKMKKKNQLLYFEIKNTTETTVQQVPGKFITTKTDGTLHGYGIKNIMDVVEKYHGIFQSQMVEDYFVVMISVYADICID